MGCICGKKGNRVHATDANSIELGNDHTASNGVVNNPTEPVASNSTGPSANNATGPVSNNSTGPESNTSTGPAVTNPTEPVVNNSTDPGGPTADASTTPGLTITPDEYGNKHEGVYPPTVTVPEPPPPPNPGAAVSSPEEEEVLKISEVDLMIKSNSLAHKTDRFELTQERKDDAGNPIKPSLIIRRGDPFDMGLTFHRQFDETKDDIRLIFDVGPASKEGIGTRVTLLLSADDLPGQWGAKLISMIGDKMTLRIFTPPSLPIAKWNLKLDIVVRNSSDESKVFRYVHPDPIYILFNPWCKDDAVYLSDEASRIEYVLNDTGRVYTGTTEQISSKPWNFGQFEDFMPDVCLYLLDKSSLAWRLRGDPVHIARKISAMANSPNDSGVLVGSWDGKYDDGTAPFKWSGSVAILEEYWKTRKSVKYGQCWVFSAVVTTICRCLGLPARSVTNFSSAHDCDGSITVDSYWSKEGKPLEEYNADSVWNFHVWNDVWMTRPDLPSGFGGWQAIDATPQETSEGIYCAGPASVEALKHGLVHLPYDGPFIFAEVNADKVHWIQQDDGGWAHTIENHSVGKNISTICAKTHMRLDITDVYKFPEGSDQERTALWRAVKECSTKKELYQAEAEDMEFKMTEKDDAIVGEDFDVTMTVHNKSSEERRVCVTLTATVVNYTGVPVDVIKTNSNNICIKPQKDEISTMKVAVWEYLDKLIDMCHIKISSMCRVEQTKQFYCHSDDFRLLKPRIRVEIPEKTKVGEEVTLVAYFTNPMPKQLTKCEFHVEAASLQRSFPIKHDNVKSHHEARMTTTLTPKSCGEKEIIVSFDSRELWGLNGTAKTLVVEAETVAHN